MIIMGCSYQKDSWQATQVNNDSSTILFFQSSFATKKETVQHYQSVALQRLKQSFSLINKGIFAFSNRNNFTRGRGLLKHH